MIRAWTEGRGVAEETHANDRALVKRCICEETHLWKNGYIYIYIILGFWDSIFDRLCRIFVDFWIMVLLKDQRTLFLFGHHLLMLKLGRVERFPSFQLGRSPT